MNTDIPNRIFSEGKHAAGSWQTARSKKIPIFLHPLWRFISLKRDGIHALGVKTRSVTAPVVLDAGSGVGAYAEWFRLSNTSAVIIAADLSFSALARIKTLNSSSILPLCCDLAHLPIRARSMDAAYSIDALGHVGKPEMALDEFLRVCKRGAHLFIHSECSDPSLRWPDNELARRLGTDTLADADGHIGIMPSLQFYECSHRRFLTSRFTSPAGYLGWLIGYPEKYAPAFSAAKMQLPAMLCAVFAFIKSMPLLGGMLRLCNACTNHIEIFFGFSGGGSCFIHRRRRSRCRFR